MPLEMQAKLLRVLEAREDQTRRCDQAREPIDVRVVCATHRDLRTLATQGRFPRRSAGSTAGVRDRAFHHSAARREDLFQLVRYFLARAGRPDLGVTFGFMLAICDYDWPLQRAQSARAAVRRAVAVADGRELDVTHLPEELQARAKSYGSRPAASEESSAARRAPSADDLRARLARHKGNVSRRRA